MSDAPAGIYTIGQTPRPDLTEDLRAFLGEAGFEMRGALDGLEESQIPACGADGYPLETRLRDGTRVVVDAAFVEPLLQRAINEWDKRVAAHLILCAGPFAHLTAHHALIQPFEIAVAELAEHGFRSLELIVPFVAQAGPAARKWAAAGFSCRTHELDKKPEDLPADRWLAARLSDTTADALVFDYVGSRAAFVEEVGARMGMPVLDLGHLALDALTRTMANLDADAPAKPEIH